MLTNYQNVWLSAHPERSSEWLIERLKDGFDIHHLDGDHENNDPSNLVLIECGDHMMLHNGKKRFSRVVGMNRGGRPRKRICAPKEERVKVPPSPVDLFKFWAAIDRDYERFLASHPPT